MTQSSSYSPLTSLMVSDSSNQRSNAVVVTNGQAGSQITQGVVANSSLCSITSLEVYRGNESSFRIHQDGFSLSDTATIQVITAENYLSVNNSRCIFSL